MNSAPTATPANDAVVAAYEQLRRYVLDGCSRSYGVTGHAVLVQKGMKAWIDVASSCLTSTPSKILQASHRDDVMANQRGEIVLILTAMALHQCPEANA